MLLINSVLPVIFAGTNFLPVADSLDANILKQVVMLEVKLKFVVIASLIN
jgi:hypothetical protein